MHPSTPIHLQGCLSVSLAMVALTASAQHTAPAQSVPSPQRYNFVFIMSDDHAQQMISCYDSTYIRTPHIDSIAAAGVRFTNSFVANSLSGPSRACMLTGQHSHKNGFYSNMWSRFDGAQMTLPKALQAAGYQTAIFGKWHLGSLPTGFDYWEVFPGQGDYYNPRFINMHKDTVATPGYVTQVVTDKALQWLTHQRQPQQPFMLFIHHKACHRNWQPEMRYLNLYEDHTFALPSTFDDDYAGRLAAQTQEMQIGRDLDPIYDIKADLPGKRSLHATGYRNIIARLTPTERAIYDSVYHPLAVRYYADSLHGAALARYKYQRYMRDYAKVVRSLDDNIGRVMDYLRAHDMLHNTIVVYTSDQGFYMGEHGWFDKRFMYEESLRTPLVMALPPSLAARGEVTDMVQNIDYAPTFLQLAGAPVPPQMQGASFMPLLQGHTATTHPEGIYYHFYEYPAEHAVKRHYGIRTQRYKLIHFYNDIDAWELYDLQSDPHELHNVYANPDKQPLVRQLKAQLLRLQQQYDDPIRLRQ